MITHFNLEAFVAQFVNFDVCIKVQMFLQKHENVTDQYAFQFVYFKIITDVFVIETYYVIESLIQCNVHLNFSAELQMHT